MDPGTTIIAMPLAVTTRLLAQGRVPTAGFLAPEALEPWPFLEDLEHRGVRLHFVREESPDTTVRSFCRAHDCAPAASHAGCSS